MNDIKLQEGHPVDENLRPIKVGGKSTAIETAQHGNGARVNGDLEVTGDIKGNIKDMVLEDVTLDSLITGSITSPIDLTIKPIGGNISIFSGAVETIDIRPSGGTGAGAAIALKSLLNTDDYFDIDTTTNGATIISTVDDDASLAHLTLDVDGDITLDAAGENIILKGSAGSGIQFKHHHAGTWDIENLTQDKDIVIKVNDGGNDVDIININGAEPYVEFPNSSVGFPRNEATFSVTGVVGSGGTDDTDIDFRTGNKFRLEMTGDITTINLIFPTVSGNFLLVCTTNGDHDVTNWKVWESDESAATTADVMWAGGSVPAFTDTGIDIVSFYWDASEQQAYGVASLAFATP